MEIVKKSLNYLLYREENLHITEQNGTKYFPEFKNAFDSKAGQMFMNIQGIDLFINLLSKFFSKFGFLPTWTQFKKLVKEDQEFQDGFKKLSFESKPALRSFIRKCYTERVEETLGKRVLLELISYATLTSNVLPLREKLAKASTILDLEETVTGSLTLSDAERNSEKVRDVSKFSLSYFEELEKIQEEVTKALSRVQTINEDGALIFTDDDIFGDDEIDEYDGSERPYIISTGYEAIKLVQGQITLFVGPSKTYKTGTGVNVAKNLINRGYEIFYVDTENGKQRMKTRFYQSMLEVRAESVWGDQFIDFEYLESVNIRKLLNGGSYEKGSVVYKLDLFRDPDDEKPPSFNLSFYRSTEAVDSFSLDSLESSFKLLQPSKKTLDKSILSLKKVLKDRMNNVRGRGKGGALRLYCNKDITVEKIILEFEKRKNSGFFKKPEKTVVIIDWMELVGTTTSKGGKGWEKKRHVYSMLSKFAEDNNVSILAIDGMLDTDVIHKNEIDAAELQIVGNNRSKFDANSIVVLAVTQDEKKAEVGRLICANARDFQDQVCTYIRTDRTKMGLHTIDQRDHYKAVPEFWENLKSSKTRNKGVDKVFDNNNKEKVAGFAKILERKRNEAQMLKDSGVSDSGVKTLASD
jgi:hypothetical protein